MSSAAESDNFEALYKEYSGRVLAYCLRRSSGGHAEDALAETFAIAWRRGTAIPSEPLPWLYGVARRVLANQRRAERRQTAVARRLSREAPPTAIQMPSPVTGSEPVFAALARLRPGDRELLMLVAWEGLTHAEASEALGITSVACRLRLFRARRRLERLMSRSGELPGANVRTETKEAQP